MDRISEQLLRDSQKAVAAGDAKEVIRGRDLLSLLVRSNTSPDIPQQMRLSDADVMARKCKISFNMLSVDIFDRNPYIPYRVRCLILVMIRKLMDKHVQWS